MKRLALMGIVLALGCQPAATETASKEAPTEAADAHAGHDHGEEGPHGGHFLHLEPSGSHAEWTHDDETHLISVYLVDLAPDTIETVKFVVDIPDAAAEEFKLTHSSDAWSISSEALTTHMEMGDAVKVKFVVVADGNEQSAAVEHEEHHHH